MWCGLEAEGSHGQVGWMPRLPAAGAGRKADHVIIFTSPGSPALCCPVLTGGGKLHPSRLTAGLSNLEIDAAILQILLLLWGKGFGLNDKDPF